MRHLLFGLITSFVLVLSSSVIAQRPNRWGSPEEMAKKQTENMKIDLGLDETQATKVGEINLKYAKKHDKLRGQGADDKNAMHENMKKMNDARNAEMKKILTDEQYQKLLVKEEEIRNKRTHEPREMR